MTVPAALAPAFDIPRSVYERARVIKLVLFDVDGVLTDGRLIYGDDGQEHKAFHTHDGHGIKLLQQSGIATGVITGRTSRLLERRAKDLGIQHVYQGCFEKLPVCQRLLTEQRLKPDQVAYIGDDVVDLPILLYVGLAIAVPNAHALVRHHAHWTTPSTGGNGAAREVCELILHAQGAYDTALRPYLTGAP